MHTHISCTHTHVSTHICMYTYVHTYMYTHIHTYVQAAYTLAQRALSMPQVWFPVCEAGSGCQLQLLPMYAEIWGSNSMPLPDACWHQRVSSQLRTPPASGLARLRAALKVFSQLGGFQTIGPGSRWSLSNSAVGFL